MNRFEEGTRPQSVLITAPDVLSPEVLKKVNYFICPMHSYVPILSLLNLTGFKNS